MEIIGVTTGITINENESRLLDDFEKALDSNTHAHIRSILIGADETIPVHEGKLQLGTWQRIFLVELDGPRSVVVQVVG